MVRRNRVLCTLIFAFFGTSVCGSYANASFSKSSSVTPQQAPIRELTTAQTFTTAATATTSLRVLSWNIQFGKGTDGITNYDRLATWIANLNPDLVGLCEIPPGNVPDLVNRLIQKTGHVWYSHFVPKYIGCDEGNLILSRYPIVGVNLLFLTANRSVAEATISVNGTNVNFFATHLDDAASSNRVAEVDQLKQWAAGFSEPRVFTGDFNGGPDTTEALSMTSSYVDSWAAMMSLGTAASYPDNPVGTQTRTRRGRIDYVFYSKASTTLIARNSKIPDTRDLSNTNVVITLGTLDDKGVRPSDHNPMITDFDLATSSSDPTPTPTPTPAPTATPTPNPGTSATFQLSSSSYNVNEGGSLEIAVNRTGDLSQTNSVNYATGDISAQQQRDYIMSAGMFTFAPGETRKTFTLWVVDDGYSEPTETLSVTLSSPTQGTVLGSANATVSIVDNDATASTTSPLDNASFFVQEHYLDFLNRGADTAGLSFWSSEITSCGGNVQCLELKRLNVSAAFFLSIEFQETGFLACMANKAAFAGYPAYAQFIRDSQALRTNYIFGQAGASTQLETNKQAYFKELISRASFHAKFDGMSNDQYVDTLIANTRLTLTASERQALINGLNAGTENRGTVLRTFAEKPALRVREFNAVFVLMEYFGYLRRDPDSTGFIFWLTKLNSFGGNFVKAEMVKAFIQSSEYYQRFGSAPMN